MENIMYGYARVSSETQSPNRQVQALMEYGVNERNIIIDVCTGVNFRRKGYNALYNVLLKEGDTLVIKSIDRLGRNKRSTERAYNNIIDDTIKYTDSPISYNYKPQGIHVIRYNSYRTLLTNVTVRAVVGINEYISFNLDHIWIIYDLRIKGYNLNDYISNFYGQVMKYRRKNGSIDYGIYFI